MPWHPHPKMHSHDDSRNVTSISHARPWSRRRSGCRGPCVLLCPSGTSVRDRRRSLVNIDDTHALLTDLQSVLGPDGARAEPLELALYSRDAGVARGRAAVVCFPRSGDDVANAVRAAAKHGRSFVTRGSGTGLAGGATPVDDPVVIVTTRLNRVLEVDADERVAWVEPGVLNLDLSREVAQLGLHYAPDPSSQQACTIGGNVATNAGGPHCLASGVTATHVLALDVVLADGTVARLGGLEPDQPGLDLRGAFVGSEGTMGIATRIAVRLQPNPPEVMDARITRAVEDFCGAGYPRDAEAVLLIELDGLPAGVEAATATIDHVGRSHGARNVRIALDPSERAL